MMSGKGLIVGLGSVGRLHLSGLLNAGLDVDILDPRLESVGDIAQFEETWGDSGTRIHVVTSPASEYDLAVLSQLAPDRSEILSSVLATSSIPRCLLEKPVVSDRFHLDAIASLEEVHRSRLYVNLVRRRWPHYERIRELIAPHEAISMTAIGGAIGLGCNGIHILDSFVFLAQAIDPRVRWSTIDDALVASGRGSGIVDYGGAFVVQSGSSILTGRLSANSSAGVRITVQGDSWQASLDYSTKTWSQSSRDVSSQAPKHRYGLDYRHSPTQAMEIPSVSRLTQDWVEDESTMPTFAESRPAHDLLFDILETGGLRGPFSFT